MLKLIVLIFSVFEIAWCQPNFPVDPINQGNSSELSCTELLGDDRARFAPNRNNPCSFYCVLNQQVTSFLYREGKQCSQTDGLNFGACVGGICQRVDSKLISLCTALRNNTNYAKKSESNSCQVDCFVLPKSSFQIPAADGSTCSVDSTLGYCRRGICSVSSNPTSATPVPAAAGNLQNSSQTNVQLTTEDLPVGRLTADSICKEFWNSDDVSSTINPDGCSFTCNKAVFYLPDGHECKAAKINSTMSTIPFPSTMSPVPFPSISQGNSSTSKFVCFNRICTILDIAVLERCRLFSQDANYYFAQKPGITTSYTSSCQITCYAPPNKEIHYYSVMDGTRCYYNTSSIMTYGRCRKGYCY